MYVYMYFFLIEDSSMHVVSPFINESHLPLVLKTEIVKILKKKMFGIQFLQVELMVLTVKSLGFMVFIRSIAGPVPISSFAVCF